MKPQSLFYLLFIIILLSCKKNKWESIFEDYYIARFVRLYLQDSTGQNMIGKNGEKYNSDSIQIFLDNDPQNTTGNILLDSNKQYYVVIFYLYQLAFEEKDINNFYIDLPETIYLTKPILILLRSRKILIRQLDFITMECL
jgi:hypothetical protein